MKKWHLLLIFLLTLPASLAQAQTAMSLEALEVQLWPDYDRQAVLVLLTGTLPANTPLPTTLSIPLPEGADFNVAARITDANEMTDQGMSPNVAEDEVTFALSDRRFRVEYYQPYTLSNNQRRFVFNWQSDMAVEQITVSLQQPFAATEVITNPAATSVSEGQDGLTYHVFPGRAVAANDTYRVEVTYTMSAPALTADFLVEDTAVPANEELPLLDAVPVQEPGFNWQLFLIALGVLIMVATVIWFVASSRGSGKRRPAKPKPQRAAKQQARTKTAVSPASLSQQTGANFCHECGERLQTGDNFCRHCGTAVKRK